MSSRFIFSSLALTITSITIGYYIASWLTLITLVAGGIYIFAREDFRQKSRLLAVKLRNVKYNNDMERALRAYRELRVLAPTIDWSYYWARIEMFQEELKDSRTAIAEIDNQKYFSYPQVVKAITCLDSIETVYKALRSLTEQMNEEKLEFRRLRETAIKLSFVLTGALEALGVHKAVCEDQRLVAELDAAKQLYQMALRQSSARDDVDWSEVLQTLMKVGKIVENLQETIK